MEPATSQLHRKITGMMGFALILLAIILYGWDMSRPGWDVMHGKRFVALMVVMWAYAIAEALLVNRRHGSCWTAVASLTLAPISGLDGGGRTLPILGWLIVVVLACWFAGKALVRGDVQTSPL
jgi:hypothetical protein